MTATAAKMKGQAERFRLPGIAGIGFAGLLFVVLLLVNVYLNPERFLPHSWGTLIGLAAPLISAALASTPAILSGRGGLDVSIGPLMGFVNAIVVTIIIAKWGLAGPVAVWVAAIVIGAAFGAFNGFLAAIVRIQPIVATLGTYLVLAGLTTTIVPSPTGTIPSWFSGLSGAWSFIPLLVIGLLWFALTRTPYYTALMATGSEDRAAFTSGLNVTLIRFLAYLVGGVFAGIAGLSLTALIGSADPNIGETYTLLAISSVALGGVSLAGGRGGFIGATIGALDIFLLQSALIYFNVSTFILQTAYGAILVLAVASTAMQKSSGGRDL
ncbi:MAG TPA: ABC transporter permease [Rhizobiaceae bacterium]|nr:ABC transporter permease [Rhizobiaceae bacterium]